MSTALQTVQDYITDARTLLQDTIPDFRYTDAELLVALNVTLLEARRLRADLFVYQHGGHVQTFSKVDTTEVRMEEPFRLAIVFGVCAHALARDQEDTQDVRSSRFMGVFNDLLLGVRPRPIAAPQQAATAAASGGV